MAVSQFCIVCPQTFVFSFLSNLSSFPPKSPRVALRKHYFIAIAASDRAFAMRAIKGSGTLFPAGDGVHGFERSGRARQSTCAQAAECFEDRFSLRRDVR